jgi:GNAT superfamily N-acetyltransferase
LLQPLLHNNYATTLPEYFGLPEANQHYEQGMQDKSVLAMKINNEYVGLLALEFPYTTNANIFWLGIKPKFHRCGFGYAMIKYALDYCKQKGFKTLTVETLSPSEKDENYMKTFKFYCKCGFLPLFDLKPNGYEYNMTYMYINIT